ncbi:MAG: nucleotidyltransferase domain-containing protein [Gaiellaceae bacterium MAG52_C11]|nr:nucleotidyltransferase domain-containing protein [Candidatus Gaiellasilicea maunaloa]
MDTLARASLTDSERRALERLVPLLEEEFGDALHAVWLYGSRARGEPPHEESDIDLLIVADDASNDGVGRAYRRVDEATAGEELGFMLFSPRVYTPEYVANRREIRSFFIQEVDRDKIVLYGEP